MPRDLGLRTSAPQAKARRFTTRSQNDHLGRANGKRKYCYRLTNLQYFLLSSTSCYFGLHFHNLLLFSFLSSLLHSFRDLYSSLLLCPTIFLFFFFLLFLFLSFFVFLHFSWLAIFIALSTVFYFT